MMANMIKLYLFIILSFSYPGKKVCHFHTLAFLPFSFDGFSVKRRDPLFDTTNPAIRASNKRIWVCDLARGSQGDEIAVVRRRVWPPIWTSQVTRPNQISISDDVPAGPCMGGGASIGLQAK